MNRTENFVTLPINWKKDAKGRCQASASEVHQ